MGGIRAWFEDRRKNRQRREVIAKHTKKAAQAKTDAADPKPADEGRDTPAPAPARAAVPPVVARKRAEPVLPLTEPEPAKPQRRQGAFTLPPPSLLDAPKVEQKIDERELMDAAKQLEEKCREFAVEGQVAQIHPGPGGDDVRVQA
jgi:S-DNA-T family DNA segregation ATPase FtsK/SpoIIIE